MNERAIQVREVIRVHPSSSIDRGTFFRMHKIAHYTALMDRDSLGRVVWDALVEFPYLESAAERDWQRYQRGEPIAWELPKPEPESGPELEGEMIE